MISFALVIGLGGIIVAFTVNRATYTAFSKMVREGDIAVAKELAATLGSYYEKQNSWTGAETLIIKPYQHIYLQGMQPGNMGRMADRFGGGRQNQGIHVIVTDREGDVVISAGEPFKRAELPTGKGVPVLADSRTVGYVYVGSMIGSGFLPFQNEFLKSSTRAIFLSLFSMIAAASIVGFFLIRHITRPVKKLTLASQEIAKGNLHASVDITQSDELGELAGSFNAMAGSLREAEAWKRRIIADAAHELRTPLSLIQGRLEMMLEGIYKTDKAGIELVYNETLMLTKLIEELSDLSNAEAGTVHLSFERQKVKDLLEFSAAAFLPELKDKNIAMPLKIEENLPEISADFQKINQVLGNLVSNALRYTPEGGTIALSAWYESGTGVCISVEDSGPGIPESDRAKVFDRFYRVDSHRNRASGGSGLGLAISKEIIHLHKGAIRAEEPLSGHGARIVISLPAVT